MAVGDRRPERRLERLSLRAVRSIALAALTVGCVVLGPSPTFLAALERLYAVAMLDGCERRRSADLVTRAWAGPHAPRPRRPRSSRPHTPR
ncbi:MAG TPA: hypothetical protein VHF25_09185 [Nitriliruptorales bacterium]|nr:hypothetical protein [Nitriliruptorales bacterium]